MAGGLRGEVRYAAEETQRGAPPARRVVLGEFLRWCRSQDEPLLRSPIKLVKQLSESVQNSHLGIEEILSAALSFGNDAVRVAELRDRDEYRTRLDANAPLLQREFARGVVLPSRSNVSTLADACLDIASNALSLAQATDAFVQDEVANETSLLSSEAVWQRDQQLHRRLSGTHAALASVGASATVGTCHLALRSLVPLSGGASAIAVRACVYTVSALTGYWASYYAMQPLVRQWTARELWRHPTPVGAAFRDSMRLLRLAARQGAKKSPSLRARLRGVDNVTGDWCLDDERALQQVLPFEPSDALDAQFDERYAAAVADMARTCPILVSPFADWRSVDLRNDSADSVSQFLTTRAWMGAAVALCAMAPTALLYFPDRLTSVDALHVVHASASRRWHVLPSFDAVRNQRAAISEVDRMQMQQSPELYQQRRAALAMVSIGADDAATRAKALESCDAATRAWQRLLLLTHALPRLQQLQVDKEQVAVVDCGEHMRQLPRASFRVLSRSDGSAYRDVLPSAKQHATSGAQLPNVLLPAPRDHVHSIPREMLLGALESAGMPM
ncbi:MAG: hypothetical protein MHM6MM_000428 [Cercozoa sp. M6MM]